MKYFTRLKVYKNSTGSNFYDPAKQEAFSFGWWRYLQNIDGKLVFNNYSYSNSTSKHQSALWRLLGYDDSIIRVSLRDGLQGISSIKSYIEQLRNDCEQLKAQVLSKGTRRTSNEQRTAQIKFKLEKMQKLIDTFNLIEYNKNVDSAKGFYNEALSKYGGSVKVAIEGYILEEVAC